MITISNLSVSMQEIPILHTITLSVEKGTIHALIGPNGSGKSTLAHVLMGNPLYTIHHGVLTCNGIDITHMAPEKRAQLGIFLAFQYPLALPGVKARVFLYEIHRIHVKEPMALPAFVEQLQTYCALVGIDNSFLERSLNDGFSGGEKKRFELLQMLVIKPKLVILDEIDSGLDVDGLKIVAHVLALLQELQPTMSVILITHYQRLLDYITPDYVHIMREGKLIKTGTLSLVHDVEQRGYDGIF